MSMTTIAVLDEGQIAAWPQEIQDAATRWATRQSRRDGDFGYGHILGRAGTAEHLIVATHQGAGANLAQMLADAAPGKKASEALLQELRLLLAGHGYFVRRPGRSRGEGPVCWGYADEVKSGKQTPPETNPIIQTSAGGLAVILENNLASTWPRDISISMTSLGTGGARVSFGYGKVLSVAFADTVQLAGLCGASGQALRPDRFADPCLLAAAADLLRQHGHALRAPGQKDYAEPLASPASAE